MLKFSKPANSECARDATETQLVGVQKQCSTFPVNNDGIHITLLKTKFLLEKKIELILLEINLNKN